MSCRHLISVALLYLLGTAGCGYDRPQIRGPGTIQQQQLGATVHDPYADPNMAPEVVGSRPRDFQKPLPEPVRNQPMPDALRNRWFSR